MTLEELAVVAAKSGLAVDIISEEDRWVTGLDHEASRRSDTAVFFVRKEGEASVTKVEVE